MPPSRHGCSAITWSLHSSHMVTQRWDCETTGVAGQLIWRMKIRFCSRNNILRQIFASFLLLVNYWISHINPGIYQTTLALWIDKKPCSRQTIIKYHGSSMSWLTARNELTEYFQLPIDLLFRHDSCQPLLYTILDRRHKQRFFFLELASSISPNFRMWVQPSRLRGRMVLLFSWKMPGGYQ